MYLTVSPEEGAPATAGSETRVTEPFAVAFMAAEWEGTPPPGDSTHGRLTAREPVTGDIKWEKRYDIIPHSALLSTGGGLLFNATYDGWLEALDAESGDLIWRFNLGSGTNGGIISYEAGGKQYIAVATGHGSHVGRALGQRLPQGQADQLSGGRADRRVRAVNRKLDAGRDERWHHRSSRPVLFSTTTDEEGDDDRERQACATERDWPSASWR